MKPLCKEKLEAAIGLINSIRSRAAVIGDSTDPKKIMEIAIDLGETIKCLSATMPEMLQELRSAQSKPVEEYRIFRDGNAWCAIAPGFVNLHESEAGFGPTPLASVWSRCAAFWPGPTHWPAPCGRRRGLKPKANARDSANATAR